MTDWRAGAQTGSFGDFPNRLVCPGSDIFYRHTHDHGTLSRMFSALRSYKYGLTRRHRLNRKLTAALADFDPLNFEEVSRELTRTEANLEFPRGRIGEHLAHTGHNPLTEPAIKPRAPATMNTRRFHAGRLSVESPVPFESSRAEDGRSPCSGRQVGFAMRSARLQDELLRAIRELTTLQGSTDPLHHRRRFRLYTLRPADSRGSAKKRKRKICVDSSRRGTSVRGRGVQQNVLYVRLIGRASQRRGRTLRRARLAIVQHLQAPRPPILRPRSALTSATPASDRSS